MNDETHHIGTMSEPTLFPWMPYEEFVATIRNDPLAAEADDTQFVCLYAVIGGLHRPPVTLDVLTDASVVAGLEAETPVWTPDSDLDEEVFVDESTLVLSDFPDATDPSDVRELLRVRERWQSAEERINGWLREAEEALFTLPQLPTEDDDSRVLE